MDDADVGSQRDLEASAESVPVHGGDHRNRHLLPDPAHLLAEVGDAPRHHRSGVPVGGLCDLVVEFATGHLLERAEVEAGAEGRSLPRQHHGAQAWE